jgi:hypothetical protein
MTEAEGNLRKLQSKLLPGIVIDVVKTLRHPNGEFQNSGLNIQELETDIQMKMSVDSRGKNQFESFRIAMIAASRGKGGGPRCFLAL